MYSRKKHTEYPRLNTLENVLARVEKCLEHIKPDMQRLMHDDPTSWQIASIQDRFIVVIANGLAGCGPAHMRGCGLDHESYYCKYVAKMVQRAGQTPIEAASDRWIASVACGALASFRKCGSLENPFVTTRRDCTIWSRFLPEITSAILNHSDQETRRTLLMVSKAWNNKFSSMSLYGIAIQFVRKFRKAHFLLNWDTFLKVLRSCLSFGESLSRLAFTSFARQMSLLAPQIIYAKDCGEGITRVNWLDTSVVTSNRILQIQNDAETYAVCFTFSKDFGEIFYGRRGGENHYFFELQPMARIWFCQKTPGCKGSSSNKDFNVKTASMPELIRLYLPREEDWSVSEVAGFIVRPGPLQYHPQEQQLASQFDLDQLAIAAYGEQGGLAFMLLWSGENVDLEGLPDLEEGVRFVKKDWVGNTAEWGRTMLGNECLISLL